MKECVKDKALKKKKLIKSKLATVNQNKYLRLTCIFCIGIMQNVNIGTPFFHLSLCIICSGSVYFS